MVTTETDGAYVLFEHYLAGTSIEIFDVASTSRFTNDGSVVWLQSGFRADLGAVPRAAAIAEPDAVTKALSKFSAWCGDVGRDGAAAPEAVLGVDVEGAAPGRNGVRNERFGDKTNVRMIDVAFAAAEREHGGHHDVAVPTTSSADGPRTPSDTDIAACMPGTALTAARPWVGREGHLQGHVLFDPGQWSCRWPAARQIYHPFANEPAGPSMASDWLRRVARTDSGESRTSRSPELGPPRGIRMSPKRMPLPLHENAERSAPISGSVPASGVRPLRIAPLSIVQRVAERPEPQRAPTELGRYTVLREVASGGMATVYVGRQTGAAGFERIVAIKCCHERLRANDDFASMFLEEARLAARIRHPNVVATLDVSDGVPLYLVMEYVEGESVASLMRAAATRGQRLPLDVSLSVMIDALSGLQAAHECRGPDGRPLGLIHCDVSPQNILVGVDGTARITDFGIARAATHVASDRNVIEGKLSYLAPEQLSSEPITQRADVFSAGVVLWELLAGRPLFSGDSDAATICAVLSHVPAPPSSFDATIPRALDAIVLRALARDPAARFRSAAEFLTALERLAIGRATARGVGEYVRRSADVTAVPPESGSGEYRSVANDARNTETTVDAVEVELLARLGAPTVEAATRVVEVPPELVAATRRPASMSLDAGTARRLIAAITLVLVGCAVGLLVATSGAPPARASAGATTSQPANAAPLAAPR